MALNAIENKGIKRVIEQVEDEKRLKKPCVSDKKETSFQKLMEKLANANFPNCDDDSKYERLAKIGQGTFGEVFKARDPATKRTVALKKVLMENEKEGFPITALREIKILKLLKHENIVNLIEVCQTKPSSTNRYKATFYLVFDFCEHDLAGLLSNQRIKFSLGEIKMVIKQLLSGLYFIHSNHILHRSILSYYVPFLLHIAFDKESSACFVGLASASTQKLYFEDLYLQNFHYLQNTCQSIITHTQEYLLLNSKLFCWDMKSANILITKTGTLKIADFGLARTFSEPKSKPNRFTNRVVTLWYRPPELLLGEKNYGPAIDLWGAGCIMAEMWTRCPLMQGNTEIHQLNVIIKLCGSISPDTFPGCVKLDLYNRIELPKGQKRKLKERLQPFIKDPYALDLLDKLLNLDPAQRIDSDHALMHDFFWADPLPCDLAKMLQPLTQSMFEYYHSRVKENVRLQNAGPSARPRPNANDGEYFDRVF